MTYTRKMKVFMISGVLGPARRSATFFHFSFVLHELRNERPRMEMPNKNRKLAAHRFFDIDLLLIKSRAGKIKRTTEPLNDPVKLRTISMLFMMKPRTKELTMTPSVILLNCRSGMTSETAGRSGPEVLRMNIRLCRLVLTGKTVSGYEMATEARNPIFINVEVTEPGYIDNRSAEILGWNRANLQ